MRFLRRLFVLVGFSAWRRVATITMTDGRVFDLEVHADHPTPSDQELVSLMESMEKELSKPCGMLCLPPGQQLLWR
jgi:hypothetical protein